MVKVRNQSNFIVAKHLTASPDPHVNGEFLLIETVAPAVRFFVDVGAHTGDWTSYLLERAPAAKGVLFEPNPRLAKPLAARFHTEMEAVLVLALAVGDQVGEGVLHLHESEMLSSLSVVGSESARGAVAVGVTTLDHEANSWPLIDLLKIDAEGYDALVLAGARGLLERHGICVLTFEYNESWRRSGSTLGATLRFLDDLGYTCCLVSPNGLRAFDYELWGEFFEYANFAAFRREDRALVESLLRVEPVARS